LEEVRVEFFEPAADTVCTGRTKLAMGTNPHVQVIADGVTDGFKNLSDAMDRFQRVIARAAGDRRERVQLGSGGAFFNQLGGSSFARYFRFSHTPSVFM